MIRTIVIIVLVACLPVIISQSATSQSRVPSYSNLETDSLITTTLEESWTRELNEKSRWLQLAPNGLLLVGVEKALHALNPEDGTDRWSISEIDKFSKGRFEIIKGTDIAIINAPKGLNESEECAAFIDLHDGTVLWNTRSDGIRKSKGAFLLPEAGLILFYCERAEEPKGDFMYCLDAVTLDILWKSDSLFGTEDPVLFYNVSEEAKGDGTTLTGNLPPIMVSDSSAFMFATTGGPFLFNPYDGSVLWRADARVPYTKPTMSEDERRTRRKRTFSTEYADLLADDPRAQAQQADNPPCMVWGYAFPVIMPDQGVIYYPVDDNIAAVRIEDGSHIWTRLPYFGGTVTSMTPVEEGMLVLSHPGEATYRPHEIALIDYRQGERLWQDTIGFDHATNPVVQDSGVLIYGNDSLHYIDLTSGQDTTLFGGFEFEGGEHATGLEVYDDTFVVYSAQNFFWLDSFGSVTKRFYSDYGKKSFLSKLVTVLAITALNVASAYAAQVQANTMAKAYGFGSASYTIYNPFYYARDNSGPIGARARIKAPQFFFVPVKLEERYGTTPGLAVLSRYNGEVLEHIFLGGKDEEYVIDPFTARLFHRIEDKRIIGYQFDK